MKQKFIYVLLCVFSIGLMTACTEDEDLKKIQLTDGSKTEMTVYSNQSSGDIFFKAQAAWSCHLSDTPSRSMNDLEWITLHTTSGQAGEATIHFTLDPNTTGQSRTAYIVILCEDTQIVIKITQSTEEDPDGDEPDSLDPRSWIFNAMHGLFRTGYLIDWDGNRITYRDNIVDQIFGNLGTATLNWDFGGNKLRITDSNGVVWNVDYELTKPYSWPLARRVEIIHVDGDKTVYELDYKDLRLVKCCEIKNGNVYETTSITWNDEGDIASVKTTYNQSVTIMTPKYYNMENIAGIMEYDTFFWVDLDDAQILYYCGLLGMPTRHLLEYSTAVETEGEQTYHFSCDFQYSFDSKERPIKVVYRETEEGEGSHSDYIDYTWKDRY